MIPVKEKKVPKQPDHKAFVPGVYDHTNLESDSAACGFDMDEFISKTSGMNALVERVVEKNEENFVSNLAEEFEKLFTPREIAFMAGKMTYMSLLQEAIESESERAKKGEPNLKPPINDIAKS